MRPGCVSACIYHVTYIWRDRWTNRQSEKTLKTCYVNKWRISVNPEQTPSLGCFDLTLVSLPSNLELGDSISKCTNWKPSKNRFCSFLVQRYPLRSYSRIPNIFALGSIFWVLRGFEILGPPGTPKTSKSHISAIFCSKWTILVSIFKF